MLSGHVAVFNANTHSDDCYCSPCGWKIPLVKRGSRMYTIIEPPHEIFNNVVCATIKASDQPAHTRSLIRAFASRLNILRVLSY